MFASSVSLEASELSGFYGPFPLSAEALPLLNPLLAEISSGADPMNLHVRSDLAKRVIADPAISLQVQELFGSDYQLWRTNFFQRQAGQAHPGVPWHHDKHFQDGTIEIDYNEVGCHVSILIALAELGPDSGLFQYIPGSFRGSLPGYGRDRRPFFCRPLTDHFLELPEPLLAEAICIKIPAAHFCLFHSALLHGSAPSSGKVARASMVGRLVRGHCLIPMECADSEQIVPFC